MKQIFPFLFLLIAFRLSGATVIIPLQNCGIDPATNRNFTLTPYSAYGQKSIPLTADRIYGVTDVTGNSTNMLLPGVYQCDVYPVPGFTGKTEFYFAVDPSNAVQNAFSNTLTTTLNTFPPNQFFPKKVLNKA